MGVRRTPGEPEAPGKGGVDPNRSGGGANQAEKILSLLRADPSLTLEALAEEMNTTVYSVRHHLDRLRAAGRIRRVGYRKTGVWVVAE